LMRGETRTGSGRVIIAGSENYHPEYI